MIAMISETSSSISRDGDSSMEHHSGRQNANAVARVHSIVHVLGSNPFTGRGVIKRLTHQEPLNPPSSSEEAMTQWQGTSGAYGLRLRPCSHNSTVKNETLPKHEIASP